MKPDLSTAIRLALAEPMPAPSVSEGGALPEWVHCVPRGKWLGHPAGAFEIGDFELDAMLANFAAGGIDVVIDYEHQTLSTEWNGLPAPAMGWINALEKRADGLWGHVREWTENGAGFLRRREYRYQSPVIYWWHEDRHTGRPRGALLHSLALTNKPFLAGDLVPVVNRVSTTTEKANMNLIMLTLLGLAASATETEQATALDTAKADHEALCARLGLDPKTTSLSTALRQASTGMVPMSEHLTQIGAADRAHQALTDDQVVVAAKAEGRLTPAQEPQLRQWMQRDRVAAMRWLAGQPPVVPVKPIETPRLAAAGGSPLADDVTKQLGITPDQFSAGAQRVEARLAGKERK